MQRPLLELVEPFELEPPVPPELLLEGLWLGLLPRSLHEKLRLALLPTKHVKPNELGILELLNALAGYNVVHEYGKRWLVRSGEPRHAFPLNMLPMDL